MDQGTTRVRHVLGLSGGKDSAALALYLRGKVPEIEYFFADTGAELDETHEFLEQLEARLGKKIVRLSAGRDFDHFLKMYGGFLPSPQARWCTKEMKLKPFERWVGNDPVVTYIGIRADEDREGYISRKANITPKYPFKEDGLVKEDIIRILEENGVGLPKYYRWRSRSGCYFCFFQQKKEWLGLYENHPDKFEQAKTYEKINPANGARYTWSQGESLDELVSRAQEIKAKHDKNSKLLRRRTWQDIVANDEDEDGLERPCLICTL